MNMDEAIAALAAGKIVTTEGRIVHREGDYLAWDTGHIPTMPDRVFEVAMPYVGVQYTGSRTIRTFKGDARIGDTVIVSTRHGDKLGIVVCEDGTRATNVVKRIIKTKVPGHMGVIVGGCGYHSDIVLKIGDWVVVDGDMGPSVWRVDALAMASKDSKYVIHRVDCARVAGLHELWCLVRKCIGPVPVSLVQGG